MSLQSSSDLISTFPTQSRSRKWKIFFKQEECLKKHCLWPGEVFEFETAWSQWQFKGGDHV